MFRHPHYALDFFLLMSDLEISYKFGPSFKFIKLNNSTFWNICKKTYISNQSSDIYCQYFQKEILPFLQLLTPTPGPKCGPSLSSADKRGTKRKRDVRVRALFILREAVEAGAN